MTSVYVAFYDQLGYISVYTVYNKRVHFPSRSRGYMLIAYIVVSSYTIKFGLHFTRKL